MPIERRRFLRFLYFHETSHVNQEIRNLCSDNLTERGDTDIARINIDVSVSLEAS